MADAEDEILTLDEVAAYLKAGKRTVYRLAADKKIPVSELKYERVDVISGAVLTGVIGLFVVVACAATLHVNGVHVDEAADAARALEPLAGNLAATLFGLGFVGAALLAAAVVPLSTAYSISEGLGRPADVDDTFREAPTFYLVFGAVVVIAAVVVLIPGAPLVPILFLTQALNAVLLLGVLPFLMALGRDRGVMGDHVLGPAGRWATGLAFVLVAAAVVALLALTVF